MPRVIYWTGIWEPTREALSKEVNWLRRTLSPRSPVVAFTSQPSRWLHRDRVLRLNKGRWRALRLAALALERFGELNHVFGSLNAAPALLLLRHRPILFTVAIPGPVLDPSFYAPVHTFVAESPVIASTLAAHVPNARIELIYPGIDVRRYTATAPVPRSPFTIVFASTPELASDLDSRGVWLLLDLARLRPDVQIRLIWRRWGQVQASLDAIQARTPPGNFRVVIDDVADMRQVYAEAHATVCCFEANAGKSAPNSVIEGLACGRPALVSDTCGIADLIASHGAGSVTGRSSEGLAAGIDRLQSEYPALALNARSLAEEVFDSAKAELKYGALYQRLSTPGRYP